MEGSGAKLAQRQRIAQDVARGCRHQLWLNRFPFDFGLPGCDSETKGECRARSPGPGSLKPCAEGGRQPATSSGFWWGGKSEIGINHSGSRFQGSRFRVRGQ
jgi:hypothetical protein